MMMIDFYAPRPRPRQHGGWKRVWNATGLALSPPPRTNWTRRVLHPVLIGHAASLTPYKSEPPGNLMGLALSPHGEKERSIRPITRYNYKEVWGGETAAREK